MKILSTKFQIQGSYKLCMVFIFIHISSMLCIFLIAFNFWVKAVFIICSTVYLFIIIRGYVLKNDPNSIIEFWYNDDKTWCLKRKSGNLELGVLNFPVFASNYLIVLNFVLKKKILETTILIATDSFLIKDDFRKLKVLLKMTR